MTTEAGRAEPSTDPACTGYLVPADIVRAWQRNQKLLEIDRPADKDVGEKLVELEQAVKRSEDAIPPSDKQILVARKLGDFLTSKKTRRADNAVVSRKGLPSSSTGQMDSAQASEEGMLASVPASYIPRARKILQAWKEKGMTWDKDGKVYLNGSPVLGADVRSLLRHATTRRAAATPPEGYKPVSQHMDSEQLPRSTYVNPVWRKPPPDGGQDLYESESERGDIAASRMPTTRDSELLASFLPPSDWEGVSDDETDDSDDPLKLGVRKRKRKKMRARRL